MMLRPERGLFCFVLLGSDIYLLPSSGKGSQSGNTSDTGDETEVRIEAIEDDYDDADQTEELGNMPAFTGMFADRQRRVDFVLVCPKEDSPEVQKIKAEYLINLTYIGFDIEFEPGVLVKTVQLEFIKIHAPDRVLLQYAEACDVDSVFRDLNPRLEPKHFYDIFFRYKYECDWLTLIQRNYLPRLMLSNLDRSYITFMVLRSTAFGVYSNYVGLERLIERNIILDAYPLHDGPYFYPLKYDLLKTNARQILFYHWLGILNAFRFQPLSVIHEYFGPKVGYYFALYGLYNLALIPLAIVGLVKMIPFQELSFGNYQMMYLYKYYQKTYDVASRAIKEGTQCPHCYDVKICPFLPNGDDAKRRMFKSYYDNPYFLLFAMFVTVWSIVFLAFWKRLEKHCNWMWEIGLKPKRPTHRIQYEIKERPKPSHLTGFVEMQTNVCKRIGIRLLSGLCFLLIFIVLGLAIFGKYMAQPKTKVIDQTKIDDKRFADRKRYLPKYYRDWYLSLSLFVAGSLILLLILEKIMKTVFRRLTEMENHQTNEEYEESYVEKSFIFKSCASVAPLIFIAWLKGAFYKCYNANIEPKLNLTIFNTSVEVDVKYLRGFISLNCNRGNCLDEAMITYAITVLIIEVGLRSWRIFFRLKTDYNLPKEMLSNVPAWEKEYILKPVTENMMNDKFASLVRQLLLMTWFVPLVSCAPALVLLVNAWHIRHEARVLLLASRRPLLYRQRGIGVWNHILSVIVYASGLALALLVIRQTEVARRTSSTYVHKYNLADQYDQYEFVNHSTGWQQCNEKGYYEESFETFTHLSDNNNPGDVKIPYMRKICYKPLANGKNPEKRCVNTKTEKTQYNNIRLMYLFQILVLITAALTHYYMLPMSDHVRRMMSSQVQLKINQEMEFPLHMFAHYQLKPKRITDWKYKGFR